MSAQPEAPEANLDLYSLITVDPDEAVVGPNVRLDARLDKQFIASIRERGVLVPVVGHRDEAGRFVVLYGQRRTLAARECGRREIPGYLVPGQEEADRLIDQMAENDHRSSLTTSERAVGFAQLRDLGLSSAQIAKRTATKRDVVDTALTVADSELATKALDRWDFLTLDEAAGLAEFEEDPEVVKALMVGVKEGRFAHALQRARDQREERRLIEEFTAALTEKGVPVVPRPAYDDKTVIAITRVRTDGKGVTVEEHASCPGHAAWVDTDYHWVNAATGEPIASKGYSTFDDDDEDYDDEEEEEEPDEAEEVEQVRVKKATAHFVCVDWAKHGHTDSWASGSSSSRPKAADMSEEERAKASAERRDVIDSNKAWKSAEVVRREWLASFFTRKTPPKGTGQFLASVMLSGLTERLSDHNVPSLRDGLLGGKVDTLDGVSEPRAMVLVLGHVLSAFEKQTGTHTWRNPTYSTTLYLRFLAANGYKLSDVEERACTK